MRALKYSLLTIVALSGLIGATSLDQAAQLPPATSLVVTTRQNELTADGYAVPELREQVIALVRTMRAGSAGLSEQTFELRGVASSDSGFGTALESLRASLPAHLASDIDVFVIDASQAGRSLCERMFDTVSTLPAQFDESGTRMRTASEPVLDRIVDFAQDCRELRIELVGHSDASGPESANVTLSVSRAQSVADYLIARGVDDDQLLVSGVGSAEPIADNTTRLGRERNRRVEFRLTRED